MYIFGTSLYANMVILRFYCIQTIEVLCSKYLTAIYIFVDIYAASIKMYARCLPMKTLVSERSLEMHLDISWLSGIYIFSLIHRRENNFKQH